MATCEFPEIANNRRKMYINIYCTKYNVRRSAKPKLPQHGNVFFFFNSRDHIWFYNSKASLNFKKNTIWIGLYINLMGNLNFGDNAHHLVDTQSRWFHINCGRSIPISNKWHTCIFPSFLWYFQRFFLMKERNR